MNKNYNFEIEKSKDRFNVVKIFNEEKKVYIGSKYKMKDYLYNFLNDIKKDSNKDSVFLIIGIGSYEEIKVLRKEYPKNKIIVIEFMDKLVDYITNNKDEFTFIEDRNLFIISGKDNQKIYNEFKTLLGDYELDKIIVRCLPNYDKIYKNELKEVNDVLKKSLADKVIFRNTSIYFSKIWFDSFMSNLKYIIKSVPVDKYENVFKNVPAVIVSAGPSLQKNIHYLKKINNDMFILSGGRTLKPLIDRNIQPNFLGIVDAGEASYELVKGYVDKTDVPLIYYEGTHEKIVQEHKQKKIFFSKMKMLDKIFQENISSLSGGGSIAHTLTMFAIKMGCNPIIFIGQDFAYTGEKYHADVAVNQFVNLADNAVKGEEKLYVRDINGNMVRTSKVLDCFRREMEKIISENENIQFINATEGGANIEGTINMTLQNAIDKYKLSDKIEFNDRKLNIDYSVVKRNCINSLNNIVCSTKKIKERCQKALEVLIDIDRFLKLQNTNMIDKKLKELDKIDKIIKCEYEKTDVLNTLLYPVAYNIMSEYKVESEQDIIEKNKFLYKSLLEKIEYAQEKIKTLLNEIKIME